MSTSMGCVMHSDRIELTYHRNAVAEKILSAVCDLQPALIQIKVYGVDISPIALDIEPILISIRPHMETIGPQAISIGPSLINVSPPRSHFCRLATTLVSQKSRSCVATLHNQSAGLRRHLMTFRQEAVTLRVTDCSHQTALHQPRQLQSCHRISAVCPLAGFETSILPS